MVSDILIKAVVITISDSRTESDDLSGTTLANLLTSAGVQVLEKIIVPDDTDTISRALIKISESDNVNLIITTGGTGISPRDNTPEATLSVIEKEIPGISEAMRLVTMQKNPRAILSRGVSGIRKNTLIINLPGSPKAVQECFEIIRPILNHAIELIEGKKAHP